MKKKDKPDELVDIQKRIEQTIATLEAKRSSSVYLLYLSDIKIDNSLVDIVVPKDVGPSILSELSGSGFCLVDAVAFTATDREDWFQAYDATNAMLNTQALVRSPVKPLNNSGGRDLSDLAVLQRHVMPSVEFPEEGHWLFVTQLSMGGQPPLGTRCFRTTFSPSL
jgi:hypothetical protein